MQVPSIPCSTPCSVPCPALSYASSSFCAPRSTSGPIQTSALPSASLSLSASLPFFATFVKHFRLFHILFL